MSAVLPMLVNLSTHEKMAMTVGLLAAAELVLHGVDYSNPATLKAALSPLGRKMNDSQLEEMHVANAVLIAQKCGIPAGFFTQAVMQAALPSIQKLGAQFSPHELRAAETYLMCLVTQ